MIIKVGRGRIVAPLHTPEFDVHGPSPHLQQCPIQGELGELGEYRAPGGTVEPPRISTQFRLLAACRGERQLLRLWQQKVAAHADTAKVSATGNDDCRPDAGSRIEPFR